MEKNPFQFNPTKMQCISEMKNNDISPFSRPNGHCDNGKYNNLLVVLALRGLTFLLATLPRIRAKLTLRIRDAPFLGFMTSLK